MDPNEPRWRLNSSFSPPMSRRWDCRYPSDGLSNRVHDAPPYGSSMSSQSKESRSAFGSDQYLNHHHSVSDGALSYIGSPSDNPRWTPSLQRFDHGEFSTPSGGTRPETSAYPPSSERNLSAVNSFSSASPFSESSPWASSSKQPVLLPPRIHPGRRSFMSKPVYPLVFRNPVSEAEGSGIPGTSNAGRTTPSDDSRASPAWPESMLSPEINFHKDLTELRKMEASPEPNMSSRREGFRWSNASSYDFGYEGDAVEISDHISVESQRSPTSSVRYLKCGLCEKFLRQKSPWSSNRIVRNTDMPVAAVLPCQHVFHAECLEEITSKTEIHEPPCPLCVRPEAATDEGSKSFSEPLHVALRSARRNQGVMFASSSAGGSGRINPNQFEGDLKKNQSLQVLRRGGSLFRSRFKRPFPFKGKIGKDIFGAKIFRKGESSSSSAPKDDRQQSSHSRSHQSK